jgi:hypothetical protein
MKRKKKADRRVQDILCFFCHLCYNFGAKNGSSLRKNRT